MYRSILKGLMAAATSASLFVVGGPAMAASSSCVAKPAPLQGKCETGTVRANPSRHFVTFKVSPSANYKIKDEETRKVVRSGTAGFKGKQGKVSGLHGNEYKLYIDNPLGGFGYISNK